MALCNEWGIPHSQLLDWSAEDRAKAMAFALEKAERCQMCGTAPWEWEANRFAYEAVREVCFGCQQKDLLREDDDGRQAGVSVVLIPEAAAQRLREQRES